MIDAYHRFFQIEASFRMSKHDLAARLIYHHKRASIDAHLTIVFAPLAVGRLIEEHELVDPHVRAHCPTLPHCSDPSRPAHARCAGPTHLDLRDALTLIASGAVTARDQDQNIQIETPTASSTWT